MVRRVEDILLLLHNRSSMAAAIVPVGIGQRVVDIQRKRATSGTVVAVAANMRACRTLNP